MKSQIFVLALCLLPTLAHAQPLPAPIPIHGHPLLAAYTDASQLVDVSTQSNWVHGENPRGAPVANPILNLPGGTFGNGKLGHTHNDLIGYRLYGEAAGPFWVRFQIKLFQVAGFAGVNPDWQDGIRDIVWDDTGSSTPPLMRGDPAGEVVFKGALVVDPSIAKQHPTKHGWWTPSWNVRTTYDNGDIVEQELLATVFVMLDPTAPETDGYPFVSARVSAHSALHPEEAFGTATVETLRGGLRYLPIVPLSSAPYLVTFATAGYGAENLPDATTEIRADADIHHFVPGTVLFDMVQQKNHQFDYAFDPAILGPGKHPIIVGRRQVTLSNDELIVSQLVFNVKVGTTTPPPPPPPPPPVLVWQPVMLGAFSVSFDKEVDQNTQLATGRLRACIGGECLIFKP